MARASGRIIKNPLLSLTPSPRSLTQLFSSVSPLPSLCSSKKTSPSLSIFFLSFLFSFTFLGISIFIFFPNSNDSIRCTSIESPAISPISPHSLPSPYSKIILASLLSGLNSNNEIQPRIGGTSMVPLPVHLVSGNLSEQETEFWKQPDGNGYRPCLDSTMGYRKRSAKILIEKNRFLVVVAAGGLNQQRNQIIDAVVIARILEAALVVPILQVNMIWEDESEFSDIFDVEHFKKTLRADVRVVSSLPSSHMVAKQTIATQIPYGVPPSWIRAKFLKQLNQEGVLVLKGVDSKLSKNLPSDLQKLRCKVAFHALRFSKPVLKVGNQLARRMWIEGPYVALHLRLEKDVWVRTGCLTGLGPEFDKIVTGIQKSQPQYLTGRVNMSSSQRRLSGLCPLNALEMARLLKALGAPKTTRFYIAGGEPFGGTKALAPLAAKFPNLVRKEMLAHDGELSPFLNSSSALSAIDYVVSFNSDIFIPSHGGNMGRALRGHRAYMGHRKSIWPNKRTMLPLFDDSSIADEELSRITRSVHSKSMKPEPRKKERDRDVIAYPVPECMCRHGSAIF
ncbi:putative beta-glucosidase [Hibiscus syriacus]|uniref:O-fucosyltransferase family protein n=1 Tax=Hibiscus syriacus TaxID=106335 RepID=A0A6A2XYK8_HIBSY|nr:O-fucosyltransferase 37-like [Hibiscus syriacus]KAE8672295.1 putative beta-glucosidase [Hibiscus syriacus]